MDFQVKSFEDYQKTYKRSVENPEQFWEEIAGHYSWMKNWDKTLEWEFETPDVKWFLNGQLNITENCLDRHLQERGNKLALIWEPNDPKERFVRLTYRELYEEV
ncbi:MAG: acetyl-coenzyme A synthetase, partial [Flavobacteriales bacterium]|nr:acetyl-coenzyme A synthetase [Flavobacteriales bacterium]